MSEHDVAPRLKDCPKCQAAAYLLSPVQDLPVDKAVYGCTACGTSFRADGSLFVSTTEALKDVFSGATGGKSLLEHLQTLSGQKFSPALHAMLTASALEYGVQMWFDGLKQGLLLGAIKSGAK